MKKSLLILSLFILLAPSISQSAPAEQRLRGRILLQVEENGEAWYVKPDDGKRMYMKDGDIAYGMMRDLGLGITNADLAKIPIGFEDRFECQDTDSDTLCDKLEYGLGTDPYNNDSDNDGYDDGTEVKNNYNPLGSGVMTYNNTLANSLKGKILLQVEQNGEAWYINPDDNKRYYMPDGPSAYQIMRYLSLGISNDDLAKIDYYSDSDYIPECTNNNDCTQTCTNCDDGAYVCVHSSNPLIDQTCVECVTDFGCVDGYECADNVCVAEEVLSPEEICSNEGKYLVLEGMICNDGSVSAHFNNEGGFSCCSVQPVPVSVSDPDTILDCYSEDLSEMLCSPEDALRFTTTFGNRLESCEISEGTFALGFEPLTGLFRGYEIQDEQNGNCAVKFWFLENSLIDSSLLNKNMICEYDSSKRTTQSVNDCFEECCSGELVDAVNAIQF